MRLVYCGTGAIGLPSLRALLGCDGHEVVAILTQPDRPAGRDLKPRPSVIKLEGLAHGIPVLQPARVREPGFVEVLQALDADLMVVAAYGQILPPAVLVAPRFGCINIHASLLPRHRGASPIQAAILAGDAETGVTIMFVDEGLDTGDILLAESTPIGPSETAGALHDRLAELAPAPLLRAIALIAEGSPPRVAQDSSRATLSQKLKKSDGWINWNDTAELIERRIRAMNPWPGAVTRFSDSGLHLKIHEAGAGSGTGPAGTVCGTAPDGITVYAGEGTVTLREIQLDGRKRMRASDFLRGHPVPIGTTFCPAGEPEAG